jgi:hypothetical protein
MTVEQLIEHLKKFDPYMEVWTAIDDEGNGFNTVRYEPEERMIPEDETYYSEEAWEYEDLLKDRMENEFGTMTESEAAESILRDYKKVVLI